MAAFIAQKGCIAYKR